MKFQRVLKLCGGRMVLFNNRTNNKDKKAEQLKQLLAHVADVGKQNGGKPYTDPMHREIKVNKTVCLGCIKYESMALPLDNDSKFRISSVSQEEGDRLREQKRKVESQKRAAEAAVIKKNLELEFDEKMRRMAQLVNSHS